MDISPDKQNIDELFGTTAYYIDFYQRDYKWTEEPVRRLLDDIFYAFDAAYEANKALDPSPETVAAKYPWYYLNTYVTNTIDGRVYVVDGQQRLTTLTLILINLLHRADAEKSKLKGWLSSKIAGQAGYQTQFWMNHEHHVGTLQALFDGAATITADTGTTAENMANNYNLVARYARRPAARHCCMVWRQWRAHCGDRNQADIPSRCTGSGCELTSSRPVSERQGRACRFGCASHCEAGHCSSRGNGKQSAALE